MQFEDLQAWQLSRLLVVNVYGLTRIEPLAQDFGLKDQLQRAAVSVMTNIAEGFERIGAKEKLHFYNIARASCGEVRSLLYVVEDVYPDLSEGACGTRNDSDRVGQVISGLIRSARKQPN